MKVTARRGAGNKLLIVLDAGARLLNIRNSANVDLGAEILPSSMLLLYASIRAVAHRDTAVVKTAIVKTAVASAAVACLPAVQREALSSCRLLFASAASYRS